VVEDLAEPLRDDEPIQAGDYQEAASRWLAGFEDAEPAGSPHERAALRAVRDLARAVDGLEANDFLNEARRVLDREGFLRSAVAPGPPPANKGTKGEGYRCWIATRRKPREVRAWNVAL